MANEPTLTNNTSNTAQPGNDIRPKDRALQHVADRITPPEQPAGFLTLQQLLPYLPLCERTVRAHIAQGKIPSIRLPGSRRFLFDLQSVRAALLRYQRGGI